jgi:hypothetical protein
MDETFANSWVPWEAYGVTPTNADGWSFSRSQVQDRDVAVRGASDLCLTVLSPVEFAVSDGVVSVAGPSFWRERIRLVDARLVLRLPLVARVASRVFVLPPQQGLPTQVEAKITAFVHESGELEAIWQVNSSQPFVVRKGQPISQVVAVAGAMLPEIIKSNDLRLRVWRLHPRGAQICPADKTLRGDASSAATRWCGPFTHANGYGFWLFAPVDLDIIWHGGRSFEHRLETLYTDDDASLVSRLQTPEDPYRYVPRKKIAFGSTAESVVSIWSGCIFQTPPGWGLLIRDPVNINASTIFRVQEAILETGWLPYDIWVNLLFVQQGKWANIRRNEGWPPLAQLLPVPKNAYDPSWRLEDGQMERTTVEGNAMFDRWIDYNYRKWVEKGCKDPTTYHRQRRLNNDG